MKVFYLLTTSEQGGAQTVVYELLRAHKERGDSVVVMANDRKWLAEETEKLGYTYIQNQAMRKTYNPFVLLKSAITIRRAVWRHRPDVVSVHSSFSGFIGRVALLNQFPVVYTTHGWGFTYGKHVSWLNMVGEMIAGLFCRKVICVSVRDQDIALKYHIVPKRKTEVIYNGVAVSGDSTIQKGDTVKIAFVGRFAWPKRQEQLVTAFAQLPQTVRERCEIIFIGNGPQENSVREKAQALHVAESITFANSVSRDEALRILSQCSVAVLLSASEGFPMAVIEALQLGVSVLANDVGGIHEVVDSSVGRLLEKDCSDASVVQALTELIENPTLLTTLHHAAQERGKLYSSDRMANSTISLYNTVIKEYGR